MKAACQRTLVLLVLLAAVQAAGQPSMDQLWPNPDGLRFEYVYHWADASTGQSMSSAAYLQLSGTVATAGGTAQNLYAGHADLPTPPAGAAPVGGSLGAIWRARSDLREEIERRYAGSGKDASETWNPFLLHGGFFLKTATTVEMWQDGFDYSTWTYLKDDITVGANFTHQLVPELASDAFLYGTVGSVTATVITPFAVYDDAVRMDYVVDYGEQVFMDESGTLIGTVRSETRGHVHYVPNVGPVEMFEEYLPFVSIDCGTSDCPPEWTQWLGLVVETQSLSATAAPVPSEAVSWGEVKALFR